MIDPKELRIGNFVNEHYESGDVLPIEWTLINFHWLAAAGGEESYSPIPITPEWLERLGFKHRPQTYCDIWEATITDYPDSNDNVALMVVFTTGQICVSIPEIERYDIKHIHQLQNLYFALTGSELKLTT